MAKMKPTATAESVSPGPAVPKLDPAEYCAKLKTRKGITYPDLANSIALKILPLEVAKQQGWPTFYEPQPCQFGHVSARWTANEGCTDCWRMKLNPPKDPIYRLARNQEFRKPPEPKTASAGGPQVFVQPAGAPEPTAVEQKFLEALDRTRSFDEAAKEVGWTRALVEARISANKVFAEAVADLCERRNIKRAPPREAAFRWSKELRELFVETFVNMGELESARAAVGCSASAYFKEYETNPEFRQAVDDAAPKAARVLEDVAIKQAKAGNDKLLVKVLAARIPEYRDSVKIDFSVKHQGKSPEQLVAAVLATQAAFLRRIKGIPAQALLGMGVVPVSEDVIEVEATAPEPLAPAGEQS
jgi:hypothetical protein